MDLLESQISVKEIRIDLIYPDLDQPRKSFDLESIANLSDSIRSSGLIKPILVEHIQIKRHRDSKDSRQIIDMLERFDRRHGDDFYQSTGVQRRLDRDDVYLIIDGHRRFEAHWRGRILIAPCQVLTGLSRAQRLALQLAADSQEPIPPYQIARAIISVHDALVDELRARDPHKVPLVPTRRLAQLLGRSENDIKRAFQYCRLDPRIQRGVEDGMISYAIASEIGRIPDFRAQDELFAYVLKSRPSLRELSGRVDAIACYDGMVLSQRLMAAVQEEHDSGAKVVDLKEKYGSRAIEELSMSLLGADQKAGVCLSGSFIKAASQEVEGLSRQDIDLFLARNKPRFRQVINAAIEQQTYPRGLFGAPIIPEVDDSFERQRQAYYTILNRAYETITSFIQLAIIDAKLIDFLLAKNGFGQALGSFKTGLDSLISMQRPCREPHCEDDIRRYSKAGIMLFGVSCQQETSPARLPSRIVSLPISQFCEDEENARRTFDDKSIERLALNIKANGLIEPLLVERVSPDSYQIITGHRRYRASLRAGLLSIRCIPIDHLSRTERTILQIVEDSQKPFTPSERATYWFLLYKLMNTERKENDEPLLTVHSFAASLGKQDSLVREAFSFLSLPESVRSLVDLDVLTYTAAIELSYLPQRYEASRRARGEQGRQRSTTVRKDYSFDPERDFYLTPEQVFCKGEHPYKAKQLQLALKASYFTISPKEVKALMEDSDPFKQGSACLFSREEIETVNRHNERVSIVDHVYSVISSFSGSISGIVSQTTESDYMANVVNYDLLVSKTRRLKERFTGLERLMRGDGRR